jgi:hypothetical protein
MPEENTQKPAENTTDNPTEITPPEETISRKEFDKVKGDMHKYKDALRQEQAKIKALEEEKLKKAQEWEKLYEKEKEDKEKLLTETTGLKQAVVRTARLSAVKEAALKAGLRKEALEDLKLVDLGEVEVESSGGEIACRGADSFVARLKTLRPHWFATKPNNINTDTPTTTQQGAKTISYKEIDAAEAEAKKTGDYREYKRLVLEFKKQQLKK